MTYKEFLKEIERNARILSEENWFDEDDKEKIEKAMKAVIKDYIKEYTAPYHYDITKIIEKYLKYDLLGNEWEDIYDCIENNRKRFIKDFKDIYPQKIYDVLYNWIVGNVKEKRFSLEERLSEHLNEEVI